MKFSSILKSEQKKYKITLSGGDITRSSRLVITIIVIGHSKIMPVLRKGSNDNDDIYVTGNIGDSFLGLEILKKNLNFNKLNSFYIKKYYKHK